MFSSFKLFNSYLLMFTVAWCVKEIVACQTYLYKLVVKFEISAISWSAKAMRFFESSE